MVLIVAIFISFSPFLIPLDEPVADQVLAAIKRATGIVQIRIAKLIGMGLQQVELCLRPQVIADAIVEFSRR